MPEPARYNQHHPETTPLYGIVAEHLETFLEHARERTGKRLPKYVEAEFRRYVECGIPAHGFARARCADCGHSLFLAFSCKLRGVCPSCNARRMCDTAAHLTDHVFPDVRLRQWVLSVPYELRLLLAVNPKALTAVGRIFCAEITRWQVRKADALGYKRTRGGAVCFVQRFGGSLNLNVHYHVAALDAVFRRKPTEPRATTVELAAPNKADVEDVAAATCARVVSWLARHGYLESAEDHSQPTPLQMCLAGSLGLGLIHRTEGKPQASSDESPPPTAKSGLIGECNKFNVHAGVSVDSGDTHAREHLLRYCARAPLSLQRLAVLEDGRISYQLRHAYKGRAAVRIMTPMQFMGRLAALIPPPRHPLVRFYGVFAPNSKWRRAVVPQHEAATHPPCAHGSESGKAQTNSKTAPNPRTSPKQIPAAFTAHSPSTKPHSPIGGRIDWATLLKRVHGVDALQCPQCGGKMRFVELVEDKQLARDTLAAEGQPCATPPVARARAPDWQET